MTDKEQEQGQEQKQEQKQEQEQEEEQEQELEQQESQLQQEQHKLNGYRKKGGGKKWIIPVIAIIAAAFAALGYVGVAESYSTRLLPNTAINGIDCSDMGAAEAAVLLTPSLEDYVLEVKGRSCATGESGAVLGSITSADAAMHYEGVQASVEEILAKQNKYRWIFSLLSGKTAEYSLEMTLGFDRDKVRSLVQSWEAFQEKNMQESHDAYISKYVEKINGYEIVPEQIGSEILLEQAYERIYDSLYSLRAELDLESAGCYKEVSLRRDDKLLIDTVNTANKWLSAQITYDWNGSEVVLDKDQLQEWISIVKNEPVLNREQVERFVRQQAAKYDTYGKDRKFITVHGVELTLPSGYYGWKTDIEAETEALVQLIQQGRTADREPVYSSKARKKGMSDIGNSYVEADMTHQHLYLYFNGKLVLETDFVSGDVLTGCDSPEGVFGIAYKTTNAVLRGADYVTPVSYWMPFYGNYGMHDASWRQEFGGDIYLTEGSHGCLNLPMDKAEQIYQYMSTGFPVICYFYDVDPLAGQNEEPEYESEDDEEE